MLQYTSSCTELTVGLSFPHVPLLQSLSYSLPGHICPAHPQPQVSQAPISQPSFLGCGERGRAAWALFGAEWIYVLRFSLALAIDQVCCCSSYIRSFFCSSQQLFQNCIYPDIPEFERMHVPQCSMQHYWQQSGHGNNLNVRRQRNGPRGCGSYIQQSITQPWKRTHLSQF